MPRIPIVDLDDPRVADYRALPRSRLSRASGRFIAEGRLLVERLVASRFPVLSIVCGETQLPQLPDDLPAELPVFVLPKHRVSELIGFRFHRGMLACGLRLPNPSLTELLADASEEPLLVICPEMADPTNLGGVIRNACALGAAGLLLGSGCADPYSRRVVRVSMGTALQLPIRESPALESELLHLRRQQGFELIATVLDSTAEPLPFAARLRRVALLFGSEGHGLHRRWIDLCSRTVTLPMQRHTDSLNVATATGVFLYHFTVHARQATEPGRNREA